MLERPDYRLIKASSGAEALARLESHDFALVLLDARMPGMDGFDLAPRIKERERSRNVPIIFLTAADADMETIRLAYRLGAADYLLKPLEPEVVRAKVAVFADLFRKNDQMQLLAREQAARAEAEAGRKRWEFIAEASRRLAASLDTARPSRASRTSPSRGSRTGASSTWSRRTRPSGGSSSRTRTRRRRPSPWRCGRRPSSPTTASPSSRRFARGAPQLFPHIGDAELRSMVTHAVDFESLRSVGLRSAMMVPLTARGRVLGRFADVRRTPTGPITRRTWPSRRTSPACGACRRQLAPLSRGQQAIRARDEFLSIASHELETPLTPLQLQVAEAPARAAAQGASSRTARRAGRSKIDTPSGSSSGSTRLVNELLDVSRITAGRLRLERGGRVDLGEVTRDVITRMRRGARRARAARSPCTPSATPSAAGTALRLDQVLTNLVSNAIKYGSGKPIEITIAMRRRARPPQRARPGHRHRARRSTRGSSSASSARVPGARLRRAWGWASTSRKQIVEAHGGAIHVESALGAGSTFTIELPADLPAEAS